MRNTGLAKKVGLLLLTIGIGLSAGFGIGLSPGFRVQMAHEGEVHFAQSIQDEAHGAYCAGLEVGRLAPRDGCGDADAAINAEELAPLPPELAGLRQAWKATQHTTEQAQEVLEAGGVQGPQARLSGWAAGNAVGFGLGIVFVVLGSVMCRRAMSAELAGPAETTDASAGAEDFGVLLNEVVQRVAAIQKDMHDCHAPTEADLDGFKDRIHALIQEPVAGLVAAGPRLKFRYGMEAFATVFSPLAGAERRLNRTWSTLVDRHWPEATDSIGHVVRNLEATQRALNGVTTNQ